MKIPIFYHQLGQVEKTMLYATNHPDILNEQALFCDETENFRKPMEPTSDEVVTFFFRTARNNIDQIFFCTETDQLPMQVSHEEGLFTYFSVSAGPFTEPTRYHFLLEKNGASYCYTRLGLTDIPQPDTSFMLMPDFHTPQWARGAVIYQIYTDRFYNGDTKNDVLEGEYSYLGAPVHAIQDWYHLPDAEDFRCFYGGDIAGVLQKLDYLAQLGIEAIYFNPLFLSPSSHKYDIQDYDHIDPHFGKIRPETKTYADRVTDPQNLEESNTLFCTLVSEAHKRGIRVILDGVFNHCGAFHRWMDQEHLYAKGALWDTESPYRAFFHWLGDGQYEGWWGLPNHPKLNYEGSAELQDYILNIAAKWVSPPYSADGWRLDVAADLGHSPEVNHAFWKRFRQAVKTANPDALLIAEHYGDATPWLLGDEWDTIMNYDAFMEPVSWFLTGMQKHSDAFRWDMLNQSWLFAETMRHQMSRLSSSVLLTSMNQLSNHDHSRFLTRTNRTPGRLHTMGSTAAAQGIRPAVFREAVLLLMTWPGAPTVYYGDEAGLVGWTDPDNRRTYPWGREDQNLISFHRAAIALHKESSAWKTGSLLLLSAEYGVLAYARFDMNARFLVVFQNTEEEREIHIPVWQAGIRQSMRRIFLTHATGFTLDEEDIPVTNGFVTLRMGAMSGAVYREVKNEDYI